MPIDTDDRHVHHVLHACLLRGADDVARALNLGLAGTTRWRGSGVNDAVRTVEERPEVRPKHVAYCNFCGRASGRLEGP